MNAKSKRIGSNLRKIDSHAIAPAEYAELPEVTAAMLARAEYRVGGRLKPHPRHRGPQKAPTKIALSLRLSPEVVTHFKAGGRGWQTRIDETLKKLIVPGRRPASKI
jgi:uncharacterized protein (DUF4415 family)